MKYGLTFDEFIEGVMLYDMRIEGSMSAFTAWIWLWVVGRCVELCNLKLMAQFFDYLGHKILAAIGEELFQRSVSTEYLVVESVGYFFGILGF